MSVTPEIINYVDSLLKQGYSKDQLRQFLLSYYPQNIIEEAFIEIDKQTIKNYIFGYLRQGYGSVQIKSYMNSYFDNALVENVFEELFPPPKKNIIFHNIDVSKSAIVFVGIVLLIVVFSGLGVYLLKSPQKLLDIKITKKDYTFTPGQHFEFMVDLINEGAKVKYDVGLENKISSLKTGQLIDSNKEEFAIYTSEERTGRLYIPKDIAIGKYIVESTVSWDNQRRTAYFMIDIEQDGTITQNEDVTKLNNTYVNVTEVANGKDENKITINESNSKDDAKDVPSQVVDVDEEFKALSYIRQLNLLKEEASITPEMAFSKCDFTARVDYCQKEVALASKSISYCDKIEVQTSKDSCYFGFAKNRNDYTYCEQIETVEIKSDCEKLKSLNEMVAYLKEQKLGKE